MMGGRPPQEAGGTPAVTTRGWRHTSSDPHEKWSCSEGTAIGDTECCILQDSEVLAVTDGSVGAIMGAAAVLPSRFVLPVPECGS